MTLGLRHYLESRISPEPNSGCWLWEAGWSSRGYGVFWVEQFEYKAHRIVYIIVKGSIPKGLELDHLCRNKCCCNPDHLEAVPHLVNVQRGDAGKKMAARRNTKTHCVNGHSFAENSMVLRNGYRRCRACSRLDNLKHNLKRRPK